MERILSLAGNPKFMIFTLLACSLIATVGIIACIAMALKIRKLTKKNAALALECRETLRSAKTEVDSFSRAMNEQTSRIAWLETRVRRKPIDSEPETEPSPAQAGKPSITERRHRVLSLTRRGFDVDSIANMLNAPHGEIELIIGLSKTA